MDVVSEKPVSLAEAAALLKKRRKDGELSYEQQSTLNYAEKFGKLDYKAALELKKELSELGLFSELQAVKLVDLLPKNEGELNAILFKDKLVLPAEQAKNVVKTIKKYL